MKMTVCDICRWKHNKIVDGNWRLRYKNKNHTECLKLDACVEHKHFLSKAGSYEKASAIINELIANHKKEETNVA